MKKTDTLLVGIVAGIILLVVVAFVFALNKPEPEYQADNTPEGVAFNYLFAISQNDYERAYSYLSADLVGYPRNVEVFEDDIRDTPWQFRNLMEGNASLEILSTDFSGIRADVEIQETYFYENGLFDNGQYTNTFTMTLREHPSGEWNIIDSDDYFLYCWDEKLGCD